MAWLYLIIGGLFEVGWAFGLKEADGFTRLLPSVLTIAAMVASFVCFAKSLQRIEIGTAYAAFTGIGTAGTVVIGMLVLGEPAELLKLFFVALLLGGIIGLKMISSKPDSAAEETDNERAQQI
ncbi:multidrug efflux SMR transporter [Paenibacillus oenotherae]|uniref:Multidrug efflux SMR transporter n=1 Tax=Paenibacillus oenotherae TaxID=1435645 RepID=A0ABS7D5J6_9BACL|nr:multidrug efflux SMR transporter [Paenibacillus oenotherae]MBW7475119.1 multidrug efflux SMR transporter [Paenibacillus oenotherae]